MVRAFFTARRATLLPENSAIRANRALIRAV
jgi:hypothetical protein